MHEKVDKDLEFFLEDGFLYYNGEFYDVNQESNDEIENSVIPAIRRVTGIVPHNSNFYDLPENFNKDHIYEDGFISHKDRDNGFIPDSAVVFYKKVSDKLKDEFIVYRHADEISDIESNFCIRNGCDNCEYFSICKPELVKIDYSKQLNGLKYKIVSTDISGQEAVIASAITHKEPIWISVFRNKTLRLLGLDLFLNDVFEEYYGIDVNDIHAYRYWTWLEAVYDTRDNGEDQTVLKRLISFNEKCKIIKKGQDIDITDDIKFLLTDYENFIEKNFKKK